MLRTPALFPILLVLALAFLSVVGCRKTEASIEPYLNIVWPEHATVVYERTVEVRGKSKPGSEVRLHRKSGRDPAAQANQNGEWSMPVRLHRGNNMLVFYLQANAETRQTLVVEFQPPKS
ncbi:MAG: hypothetical protein HYX89_08765 [Chloroflexi bacterium]|nr:hypothetical protein [Chloroflexota bacterium]